MSDNIKSKPLALVTGASKRSGLGFEVCRQLAAKGFAVWLTARNERAAEVLAGELRGEGFDVRSGALDIA